MKHSQINIGWQVKSISALMALLFVLNLFAVVPMSLQHPKEDGVTHAISTEMSNLAQSQEKNQHDHVEHCGMVSCSIAYNDYTLSLSVAYAKKTEFLAVDTELDSLHHAPPGRPPLHSSLILG